jgi:hypothetical protein
MAFTLLGYVWAPLSIVTSASLCAVILLPYWLEGTLSLDNRTGTTSLQATSEEPEILQLNQVTTPTPLTPTYFGAFRRCNYPRLDATTGKVSLVGVAAVYTNLTDTGHTGTGVWPVSCIARHTITMVAVVVGTRVRRVRVVRSCCAHRTAGVLRARRRHTHECAFVGYNADCGR